MALAFLAGAFFVVLVTIYQSANHGKWIFAGWDSFWNKNTDKVKDACINGFDNKSFY